MKLPKKSLKGKTKFKTKANSEILAKFEKKIYFLDPLEQLTEVKLPTTNTPTPITTIPFIGIASGLGQGLSYTAMVSEFAFLGATMLGLDSSGLLIGFVQFIKTITIFRFINSHFGSLLEEVLSSLAEYIEIKPALSKDEILQN